MRAVGWGSRARSPRAARAPRPSGRGFTRLLATLALVACNSVPTAPTPPTGRLLTTAVWPGESALVVSPEAAAAPAESVVVTAGIDTMAFSVVDDSTLAVAIPDSMFSADLGVTVHTAGGFVDVGTVHVYGYVGAVEYQGYSGYPIAFPNADAAPTVLVFDATGAARVNVETGDRVQWPGPGPLTPCGASYSTGFGSSYRADSGWATLCSGSFRLVASAKDSVPLAAVGRLVAEIGPHTIIEAQKYNDWTAHVADDGTVTPIVTLDYGINGPLSVVLSPRRDRAVLTAGAVFGDTRNTTGPSVPVFSADGNIAFRARGGGSEGGGAAAFSPTGDTLYLASSVGAGLYAYDAAVGSLLDSIAEVNGGQALYADPRTEYLYAAGGSFAAIRTLAVVDRTSLRIVATLKVDEQCWHGDTGALVAAPGHHALFFTSTWSAPYWQGSVMGELIACRFDVP